jgi:antitoxin component of RelBE/YafQ-DinJ toxin-antitoxin module
MNSDRATLTLRVNSELHKSFKAVCASSGIKLQDALADPIEKAMLKAVLNAGKKRKS